MLETALFQQLLPKKTLKGNACDGTRRSEWPCFCARTWTTGARALCDWQATLLHSAPAPTKARKLFQEWLAEFDGEQGKKATLHAASAPHSRPAPMDAAGAGGNLKNSSRGASSLVPRTKSNRSRRTAKRTRFHNRHVPAAGSHCMGSSDYLAVDNSAKKQRLRLSGRRTVVPPRAVH